MHCGKKTTSTQEEEEEEDKNNDDIRRRRTASFVFLYVFCPVEAAPSGVEESSSSSFGDGAGDVARRALQGGGREKKEKKKRRGMRGRGGRTWLLSSSSSSLSSSISTLMQTNNRLWQLIFAEGHFLFSSSVDEKMFHSICLLVSSVKTMTLGVLSFLLKFWTALLPEDVSPRRGEMRFLGGRERRIVMAPKKKKMKWLFAVFPIWQKSSGKKKEWRNR